MNDTTRVERGIMAVAAMGEKQMNDASNATIAAMGHNQPPLEEVLADETKGFRERKDALIANLNASRIASAEDAAEVTRLGGMLADLKVRVETARKAAAEPFDTGKATVQRVFKSGIIDPIDAALVTIRKMLDEWRAVLRRQEEAAQRQREYEAAAARKAAKEAEAKRKEAEAQGDARAAVQAQMAELQAKERAEALAAPSDIRPTEPIRTVAGMAATTTQRVPVVTNVGACLAWLIKNQSEALLEAIGPLIARLVRAKVTVPGVEVRTQEATRLRR